MTNRPGRIYVRGDVRLIDVFRAMRGWVEQHAAKGGRRSIGTVSRQPRGMARTVTGAATATFA